MSDRKQTTEEERRTNIRSFIIGIFIALAIMVLYVVLYFAGLIR
jgi:hypothetical protein